MGILIKDFELLSGDSDDDEQLAVQEIKEKPADLSPVAAFRTSANSASNVLAPWSAAVTTLGCIIAIGSAILGVISLVLIRHRPLPAGAYLLATTYHRPESPLPVTPRIALRTISRVESLLEWEGTEDARNIA